MPLPQPSNASRDRARRQRVLPRDLLFRHRPAPCRTVDEFIEDDFCLDAASKRQGFEDGAAGMVADFRDFDPLSYSAGFFAGRRARNSKRGD